MRGRIFYTAGHTAALSCAVERLKCAGVLFSSVPCAEVTDLLLPVPSCDPNGDLKGGISLQTVLHQLPAGITVYGGNLPELTGYAVQDLLKDPTYVAENAYITAHCAVRLAMEKLPVALRGCKILVIGWGRIGKCLAALLKGMEAEVTVAARKETDRAMLNALGYRAVPIDELSDQGYRVIFNTVPFMVLKTTAPGSLKIDLASVPGMDGGNILHALGLPGKDAPETSGELIARTVLRLMNKGENL